MDDKLWRIFENIKNWLEYAEKKNTTVLTLIGIQIAFIQLSGAKAANTLLLKVSIMLLGICFILSLISFFPRTKILNFLNTSVSLFEKSVKSENFLFYDDIAKFSPNDYTVALENYFDGKIIGNKYLEDLCVQIVVNAKITAMKFKIFKTISWFMILGQLAFLISFVI